MLSEELIQEFREIIKSEYGLDLSYEDAGKIGNDLVEFFDALARMNFADIKDRNLKK